MAVELGVVVSHPVDSIERMFDRRKTEDGRRQTAAREDGVVALQTALFGAAEEAGDGGLVAPAKPLPWGGSDRHRHREIGSA